jgi:hypothetical protein
VSDSYIRRPLNMTGCRWIPVSAVDDGRSDDRRDCGHYHQGKDHIERPPRPPPPRHRRARHEVCRAGGPTLPDFHDRLVLSRRMPSTVLGLPPPSWRPTTVPAIVGVHPPVGTSRVHRPIPQLPANRPDSRWRLPRRRSQHDATPAPSSASRRPAAGRHTSESDPPRRAQISPWRSAATDH